MGTKVKLAVAETEEDDKTEPQVTVMFLNHIVCNFITWAWTMQLYRSKHEARRVVGVGSYPGLRVDFSVIFSRCYLSGFIFSGHSGFLPLFIIAWMQSIKIHLF